LTEKALEVVKKNPQGFFLMVEGGQIDTAAHRNDVAAVLHEMLEFDRAIGVAMAFAEANPDTLVLVTADHDTGGMAIAYSNYQAPAPLKLPNGETWKTKHNFAEKVIFEKMARQKKSFQKMVEDSKWEPAALKKEIEENTAYTLTEEQAAFLLTKDPQTKYPMTKEYSDFYSSDDKTPTALMGRLFGKETNTTWASGTHTHTPVMVIANGPSGEKFRGLLDNVDIPQIIARGWGATLPAPK